MGSSKSPKVLQTYNRRLVDKVYDAANHAEAQGRREVAERLRLIHREMLNNEERHPNRRQVDNQ